MPAPSDRTERLCAMFDSYCKAVLRNASRNEKRALANLNKYESTINQRMQYLFDADSREDTYPAEQLIIRMGEFSCVIFSDILYHALLSLPEKQCMVFMLDFWYHWTDEQIAAHLNVTPRTVYNLRQRAFKTIRSFFELGASP